MVLRTASAIRPRAAALLALGAAAALALSACAPAPAPEGTPSPSSAPSSPSATDGAPGPSSTPRETGTVASVPSDCRDLYSPGFLESIFQANEALGEDMLNFPGNELRGSEEPAVRAVLDAGEPLLCTWTVGGETGAGTEVMEISVADSETVLAALEHAGYACEDYRGGRYCRGDEDISEDGYPVMRNAGVFIREGLIFASFGYNWVDSDIPDMIDTVFGPA